MCKKQIYLFLIYVDQLNCPPLELQFSPCKNKKNGMRMWRNWQTRRFQVPVGNRVGSNPFIRTSKIDKFRQEFVDFFLSIQIAYPTKKVGGNLLTKKKYAL